MAAAAELITITELAARSGVAPSALRYYESLGLIQARRTRGNQRRYRRTVLRSVAVIRAARAMGVPLSSIIVALAGLPGGRDPTPADWERLSLRWHDELDERIRILEKLRDDLSSCIGCGCLSLERCRIFNPDDRVASEGAGPRLLMGKAADRPAPQVSAPPELEHSPIRTTRSTPRSRRRPSLSSAKSVDS